VGDSLQGEKQGKDIVYTRVSNRGQKDDLKNQVEFLKRKEVSEKTETRAEAFIAKI
jgi:predicted site-specific integrase-resolvase